ncbi:hypothetical protein OG216_47565 (plasmid) [Streptomycetaceae bacterium NBC_01309]
MGFNPHEHHHSQVIWRRAAFLRRDDIYLEPPRGWFHIHRVSRTGAEVTAWNAAGRSTQHHPDARIPVIRHQACHCARFVYIDEPPF